MYACSDWLRHLCARKLWPNKRAHSFFAAARTRDHFRTQYVQDTDLSPRGLRKFNLSCLPLPMFQCLKTVHGSFYFLTIYFKCRRVLCAARCFRPLFVLRGLWCRSGLLRTAACHRLAANLACPTSRRLLHLRHFRVPIVIAGPGVLVPEARASTARRLRCPGLR